jgi:hypothetical protein
VCVPGSLLLEDCLVARYLAWRPAQKMSLAVTGIT